MASSPAQILREHDLPAVPRGGDPLGAVHVDADVAVLAEGGSAGVEADADTHRRGPGMAAEPPLGLEGCGDRGLGRGERCEELVAS